MIRSGNKRIDLDQIMDTEDGIILTPLTREIANLESNHDPQLNKIANQDVLVEWRHNSI